MTNALRMFAIDERSLTHRCEKLFSTRLFETFWQVRLILTNADTGKLDHAKTTNALRRIETQANELKRKLMKSSLQLNAICVKGLSHRCDDPLKLGHYAYERPVNWITCTNMLARTYALKLIVISIQANIPGD